MGSCQGSCFVNNQAAKNVDENVISDQVDIKKNSDKRDNRNKYLDIEENYIENQNHDDQGRDQNYYNQRDAEQQALKNQAMARSVQSQNQSSQPTANRERNEESRQMPENTGFAPISKPIQTMKDKGVPNEEGCALIEQTIGLSYRKRLPNIQLENGAVYIGEWKNGLRDGTGMQQWPDGSKYDGEWFEDKARGKGSLVHADGDVYEG